MRQVSGQINESGALNERRKTCGSSNISVAYTLTKHTHPAQFSLAKNMMSCSCFPSPNLKFLVVFQCQRARSPFSRVCLVRRTSEVLQSSPQGKLCSLQSYGNVLLDFRKDKPNWILPIKVHNDNQQSPSHRSDPCLANPTSAGQNLVHTKALGQEHFA